MFQTRINASLTFKYMAGPNSRAFISSHVAINAEIIGEIIGEIIAEIIAEINAEIIAAIIAFRKLYLRVHGYVFGSNKCAQEGEGVVRLSNQLGRTVTCCHQGIACWWYHPPPMVSLFLAKLSGVMSLAQWRSLMLSERSPTTSVLPSESR